MHLFLKREVHSPEVSGAHNPYLAGRREWDERYGDLITRARNWRNPGEPDRDNKEIGALGSHD